MALIPDFGADVRTVGELRAVLADLPDDLPTHFTAECGHVHFDSVGVWRGHARTGVYGNRRNPLRDIDVLWVGSD